ncbi:hypothetical protein KY320_00605 [Candidatus Woesearchaeota archaeon]|nr:hypothetical protein [Candidatus Woesearchaeota archaeon]
MSETQTLNLDLIVLNSLSAVNGLFEGVAIGMFGCFAMPSLVRCSFEQAAEVVDELTTQTDTFKERSQNFSYWVSHYIGRAIPFPVIISNLINPDEKAPMAIAIVLGVTNCCSLAHELLKNNQKYQNFFNNVLNRIFYTYEKSVPEEVDYLISRSQPQ